MQVTENFVIHVDRSEKSVIQIHPSSTYLDGSIFQRPYVVLLRQVWLFLTVLII
jgi:hypothetical protein